MSKLKLEQHKKLLLLWVVLTIGISVMLAYDIFEAEDKSIFMPGPMTSGHHQIGLACTACHTDTLTSDEDMQKACVDCHGDDRKKPFDSHPVNKFTDPRNAAKLENIDATKCVTCHTEHQPDMTAKNGVTQPGDFCILCHEDIGEDRPSHKEMEFNTCNSSGCHNFHNNRSLYTDFLVKHLDEPDTLPKRVLPEREFVAVLDEVVDYPRQKYPVKQLSAADADAPSDVALSDAGHEDWLQTAHAKSGVNCTACHLVSATEEEEKVWSNSPDHTVCEQCHGTEVQRFKKGKHGMRLMVGLPAMTTSEARLPMKSDSGHEELNCISCHGAHKFDVKQAAASACLDCHDDKHSLAYMDSPHAGLWEKELRGDASAGTGVSCSSCHMPRISFDVSEWTSRIIVDHNQNATLSPNEKMIRPTCLHCHGLEFTIDSLADQKLVDNNFKGKPSVHIPSMDLAESDLKRAEQERSGRQ